MISGFKLLFSEFGLVPANVTWVGITVHSIEEIIALAEIAATGSLSHGTWVDNSYVLCQFLECVAQKMSNLFILGFGVSNASSIPL